MRTRYNNNLLASLEIPEAIQTLKLRTPLLEIIGKEE